MKKIFSFLAVFTLIFLCACNETAPKHGLNVVFIDDSVAKIETVFGDDNATRLINSVDIIVKGTVIESSEPDYSPILFPEIINKVQISEVIKGENIAVGDEITVITHCGYGNFKDYIAANYDKRTKMTAEFIEKNSADPTAKVEIAVQEGTPVYEGGEFIFLLCAPEEDEENWILWSDRSSVLEVDGEKLNGYATSYLGDTYKKFLKTVEKALETPDAKYSINGFSF